MPSAFHSLLPLKREPKSKRHSSKHPKKKRKESKKLAADVAGDASFHLKRSTSASPADGGGGSCLAQPLGNLLLAAAPRANLRDAGLGALRPLPDDLLLDVLGLLVARDLAALSAASKALYVIASHDPLWRALVLAYLGGDLAFAGSWRATYMVHPSGRWSRGH